MYWLVKSYNEEKHSETLCINIISTRWVNQKKHNTSKYVKKRVACKCVRCICRCTNWDYKVIKLMLLILSRLFYCFEFVAFNDRCSRSTFKITKNLYLHSTSAVLFLRNDKPTDAFHSIICLIYFHNKKVFISYNSYYIKSLLYF